MFNQLINSNVETWFPKNADFDALGYLIEVGGKNKSSELHSDHYIVAADDIETGYRNKIPLWLFGFMY